MFPGSYFPGTYFAPTYFPGTQTLETVDVVADVRVIMGADVERVVINADVGRIIMAADAEEVRYP